jgi:hypothetical protein
VQKSPSVSHLFFADDSIILLKAYLNNAISLQQVLDSYCASLGQLVSVGKSSIFFSPNTDVNVKVDICNTLNINTEVILDKYPCLPAIVGADRSDYFLHFVERVLRRIKGWKEKYSLLVVRKSQLRLLSNRFLFMSVFLLPKNVCKKITDIISQFWWGYDDHGKKIHWYAWWKLCFPKKEGGMGLEIYILLILQCWGSRFGGLLMNQTLYVLKF